MIVNVLQRISDLVIPRVFAIDVQNPTPPKIPEILKDMLPLVNGLLFGLGPVLLVVMIVYAGFKRLMAADNPNAVKESTQTLFWGVIGYAVVLLSYLLVRLGLSVIGYDITKNDDIVL